MKSFFAVLFTLFISLNVLAQKDVTVTYDRIKQQCEDLPLNQRLRVTVARFEVTTPHTGGEFGKNMSTMLSNALQEVNCFRVLSSLRDNADLEDEIDFGESKYANHKSAPKKGNMLGPQIVVTGEVTGYNINNNRQSYGPVHVGSQTLNLSFIIQIRNPETRDILFSKKFNVTGRKGGGVGVSYGWYHYGGGGANNDAEADALGKGIVEAVKYIAEQKDKIANNVSTGNTGSNYYVTSITIQNADYDVLTSFSAVLKKISQVKNADPALDESVATISIQHSGSTQKILEEIKKLTGAKYKVIGLKDGEIKLLAK